MGGGRWREVADRRRLLRQAGALGLSLAASQVWPHRRADVAAQEPTPPDAPARPRIAPAPGGSAVDPYAWLEDPDDPEVIAYLEAENAYAEAVMAPTRALQETLFREMTGRFPRADATVPTPWRGYLYYERTELGKDYAVVCRRRDSPDAPEEILLDLNAIGGAALDISVLRPSPDNRYLAYGLDTTGAEIYELTVVEMASGRIVTRLPAARDAEWTNDSRALLYTRQDATHRPYRLQRHALGSDPATDAVLYEEADERFWLRLATTRDRTWHVLESGTIDTSEVRALPADRPDGAPRPIVPRRDGVQYHLEHHGDEFLILTDEDAPNFRLMAAPVADPARDTWREVIPHREHVLLAGLDAFARHLVLYGRKDGFPRVWIRYLASGRTRSVRFGEAVYAVGRPDRLTGGENWEFATATVRLAYSSPVTPPSVYAIDLATGERTLLKREKLRGGHDPRSYATERLYAAAPDGTRIPISLVYVREPPAGLPEGPRPLRLDAYGGYGISLDPGFSLYRLALIDRGVGFAIAHVRGGGELGRQWWEAGRRLAKKTSFSDFIACAEHLIAAGYTAPDRLAIHGGSIGGLLMGVAATERPDLFRAVVAEVPGVDVIGFLLRSPIGPVNEDELGDPRDPADYAYLASYSPYQNARARAYPAMFVTGALHDQRTPYWIPAKWVAKLRDLKTDDTPLLLRMGLGSGHLSVSATSALARELAFWYAFVLTELGLADVKPQGNVDATAPRATQRRTRPRRRR
jgi:oligopeptidase B